MWSRGYEFLRKMGFPYPGIGTLTRQIDDCKFKVGIWEEIFDFLKLKIPHCRDNKDKDCMIVMDEVAITEGKFMILQTVHI